MGRELDGGDRGAGDPDLHYDRANPALVVFDLAFKTSEKACWRYADYEAFHAAAHAGGLDRDVPYHFG